MFLKTLKTMKKILEKISQETKLYIKPSLGKDVLFEASDVFPAGIDLNFQQWKTNVSDHETPTTEVEVYRLIEEASFFQMLSFLSNNFDQLCLTQGQIKSFCLDYQHWLRKNGMSTFFLFKVLQEKFVAVVYLDRKDRLGIDVFTFNFPYEWSKEGRHHLIIPKI